MGSETCIELATESQREGEEMSSLLTPESDASAAKENESFSNIRQTESDYLHREEYSAEIESGQGLVTDARCTQHRWVLGIAGLSAATFTALSLWLVVQQLNLLKPEPSTRFFVVGDWGRNGQQNQSLVAQAMAAKADLFHPDFIISVGDNMYESGLLSVEDKQFTESFTDVYKQTSLQVPWHVILGNHDYGEHGSSLEYLERCKDVAVDCYLSPLHQLSWRLAERDSRWHCERWFRLPALEGAAELFFLDTSPFILSYRSEPWAANKGGILEQSWQSQLLELEASLAASEARWKLVIGHHPVRSNRANTSTPELVEHLEPVLSAHGVQAYFSGHEHNLQYARQANGSSHYLISGGGSLTQYPPSPPPAAGFLHEGSGFVSCQLTLESLACEFLGITGSAPLLAVVIPVS